MVGAVGTLTIQTALTDAEQTRTRAELARIAAELTAREKALETRQDLLRTQAETLRQESARSAGELESILRSQGTAIERLKAVSATLRQLRTVCSAVQTTLWSPAEVSASYSRSSK